MEDSRLPAKQICIPVQGWEHLAADRKCGLEADNPQRSPNLRQGKFHSHTPSTAFRHLPPWRKDVVKRCLEFVSQLDIKRQAIKERKANPAAVEACQVCGRICASVSVWSAARSQQRRHWRRRRFAEDNYNDDDDDDNDDDDDGGGGGGGEITCPDSPNFFLFLFSTTAPANTCQISLWASSIDLADDLV